MLINKNMNWDERSKSLTDKISDSISSKKKEVVVLFRNNKLMLIKI